MLPVEMLELEMRDRLRAKDVEIERLREEIEQLEKSAAFVSRTEWKENKQLKTLNSELVELVQQALNGDLEYDWDNWEIRAHVILAKVKEKK